MVPIEKLVKELEIKSDTSPILKMLQNVVGQEESSAPWEKGVACVGATCKHPEIRLQNYAAELFDTIKDMRGDSFFTRELSQLKEPTCECKA